MTEDKKAAMMRRVRALLQKTEEAGCTEQEAQQAAELARDLIEQYQLDMTEAELVAEGFHRAKRVWTSQEVQLIQSYICRPIGGFTGTRIWSSAGLNSARRDRHFFGLRSDVEFAEWLTSSLTAYVQMKATAYVESDLAALSRSTGETIAALCKACRASCKDRRKAFIVGCAGRIKVRLKEATRNETKIRSASGTALVTLNKRELATKELASRYGIRLVSGSGSKPRIGSHEALEAGRRAGDAASFGRPVSGRGAVFLLT